MTASKLKAILFTFLILVISGCNQDIQDEVLTAEGNWLRDNIREMATLDPGAASLDDLNPLVEMVGNARVVGIGEATHGTSQFFKVWHRVFKALVLNRGFRLIIMEWDFIPFYRMNQFIVHNQGDIHTWFYGRWCRETEDLVEWMHNYNLDKPENEKIWLLGCDIRSYREHISDILEVTETIDVSLYNRLQSLYEELYSYQSGFYYRDNVPENQKARIRNDIQEARQAIIEKQGLIVSRIGDWEYDFLQRAALVVIQSEDFYAHPDLPTIRDRHMADNIRWLSQRFGNTKSVTTSHNEHLGYRVRDDLYNIQWDSTGYYLREYFGSAYVSIGQTFYEGSFNNYWGVGHVGPPLEDSYEYFFEQAKKPLFYLNLRQLDTGAAGAWWVEGPRLFRSIDERFTSETQDRDTFCNRSITSDFDIIIYIEHSSPFNYM